MQRLGGHDAPGWIRRGDEWQRRRRRAYEDGGCRAGHDGVVVVIALLLLGITRAIRASSRR